MSNLPLYVLVPTFIMAILAAVVALWAFIFNLRLLIVCLKGKRPNVSMALGVSIMASVLSGVLMWFCFPVIERFKTVWMCFIGFDTVLCMVLIYGFKMFAPMRGSRE